MIAAPLHIRRLRLPAALIAAVALAAWAYAATPQPIVDAPRHVGDAPLATTRFATMDLFIDAGDAPLAAWQIDLRDARGVAKIVGIEGGEHAAFREPPYYDSRAMMRDHVVLAAFNTADVDALPRGRTRIATLHLRITGEAEPDWQIELITAADADGRRIQAQLTHE